MHFSHLATVLTTGLSLAVGPVLGSPAPVPDGVHPTVKRDICMDSGAVCQLPTMKDDCLAAINQFACPSGKCDTKDGIDPTVVWDEFTVRQSGNCTARYTCSDPWLYPIENTDMIRQLKYIYETQSCTGCGTHWDSTKTCRFTLYSCPECTPLGNPAGPATNSDNKQPEIVALGDLSN